MALKQPELKCDGLASFILVAPAEMMTLGPKMSTTSVL